jgi:hypothetical protein
MHDPPAATNKKLWREERPMTIRSLGLSLGIALASASAALGAETYAYTASTVAKPNKQGAVAVSTIQWNCTATGCTTKGPWPVPGVGACRALAQQVGPIKAYGHPDRQLSAADLARCNEGLSAAAAAQSKPGSSATAAANPAGTGLVARPVAGPASSSGLNSTQLRNGIQLRTQHFDALRRARQKAENELKASQANEVTRRRMAARNKGDDCDDLRRDVNPNAAEICDGRDNNCDGVIDERQTIRRYLDADGDGHGDASRGADVCPGDITEAARTAESVGGGWLVEVGNDCDDRNPDRWRDCP